MFIKTDENNNIIQLISVGSKPTENGYEIPNDTPTEIIQNIFDYKYEDGKLVRKDDVDEGRLIKLKEAKIANMSIVCNEVIERGIDYNGDHYSLEQTDQINLMKLESVAMADPTAVIFYHADNQLCRQYTSEEIVTIAQLSVSYITYHTTYFNFMKAQIMSMTTTDEVLSVNYGMKLADQFQEQLDAYASQLPFTMEVIPDTSDYSGILVDVNVDSLTFIDTSTDEEEEEILDDTLPDEVQPPPQIDYVEEFDIGDAEEPPLDDTFESDGDK